MNSIIIIIMITAIYFSFIYVSLVSYKQNKPLKTVQYNAFSIVSNFVISFHVVPNNSI